MSLLRRIEALPAIAVAQATDTRRRATPVEPIVATPREAKALRFYAQPESWFAGQLRTPRVTVDGQTLDIKTQYLLERSRGAARRFTRTLPFLFSVPAGRRMVRAAIDRSWYLWTQSSAPLTTSDRVIEGRGARVPIRIYRPSDEEPLPVLVYHHGGGWIFSSIAAEDRVCRLIAHAANVIVVSVDYRTAPEHVYPAASDDGDDVYQWVRANAQSFGGDHDRVGVGGDSAGGHIAINIAQRACAAGTRRPDALLAFYPGAGIPVDDESYRAFGQGFSLDAGFIEYILPTVFAGRDLSDRSAIDALMDPASSPDLSGMPPTIIETAGFDILRDCGRRFAEALDRDGVPVRYTNRTSLTHSYLQSSAVVAEAERSTNEAAALFGRTIRGAPLTASQGTSA